MFVGFFIGVFIGILLILAYERRQINKAIKESKCRWDKMYASEIYRILYRLGVINANIRFPWNDR